MPHEIASSSRPAFFLARYSGANQMSGDISVTPAARPFYAFPRCRPGKLSLHQVGNTMGVRRQEQVLVSD